MLGTPVRLLAYFPFFLLLPVMGTQAAPLTAWSEYDAQGVQVYIAGTDNQQQPKIIRLTKTGTNITPAITANDDVFWIVWVNRAEPEFYELKYAMLDSGSFSVLDIGTVPASDNLVYAPSVMLDTSDRLWVAWSGFDGHDSEIRLAHFSEGTWSAETNLSDNEHSDTRPQIGYDSDQHLAVWWHSNNHGRQRVLKVSCLAEKNEFSATAVNRCQPEPYSDKRIPFQFVESVSFGNDEKIELPPFLSERKGRILMGISLPLEQKK
jgi:hypothetical protein